MERQTTEYGGRGYFSNQQLPAEAELLRTVPYTWVVFKPFKKEVCAYCFHYDNGRSMKVKLEHPASASKKDKQRTYAGLHFCSQVCQDDWILNEDADQLMSSTLELIEQNIKFKQSEEKSDPTVDLWKQLKPLKQIAALESEEYDFARMVAVVVVKKWRNLVDDFEDLQSNEAQYLEKYPYMMYSHVAIFQFLQKVLPAKLKPVLTPELVRQTVGKEAGNAFGIWQQPLTLESECLGSALYTQASFFNHSCDPNVRKHRQGRDMVFTTLRPIGPNEQLCISYGMIDHLPVQERLTQLSTQWFFQCQCTKCMQQMLKL